MEVPRPNLIIAGVNKCATTSVFSYLAQHPDVCESTIKETCHYLPIRYGRPHPPLSEYDQYFRHYRHQPYVLEATPGYYCSTARLPATIRDELGPIKIILIFRDPVWRFFSNYRQMKKVGAIPARMPVDEYYKRCPRDPDTAPVQAAGEHPYRSIRDGFYFHYLERWQECFGESIQVLFFEDVQQRPSEVMEKLAAFLAVDPEPWQRMTFQVENRSVEVRSQTARRLYQWARDRFTPLAERAPFVKKTIKTAYAALNTRPEAPEHFPRDLQNELSQIFAPHNARLADALRRMGYSDLPAWLSHVEDEAASSGPVCRSQVGS